MQKLIVCLENTSKNLSVNYMLYILIGQINVTKF